MESKTLNRLTDLVFDIGSEAEDALEWALEAQPARFERIRDLAVEVWDLLEKERVSQA